LTTAYGVRAELPGVVRQPDVDAGLIGLYDSYPFNAQNQGVQSSRVLFGVDFDHVTPGGARFEFAPWAMWTDFRLRQNFSGNIYSSQLDPAIAGGLGDLWESTNRELSAGVTSRFHAAPWRPAKWLEVVTEPGLYLRVGHTDQTKSLLDPKTLQAWDRRLDAGLDTFDAGAYVDLDVRLWRRLRLSGGVRADLLGVSVDDRLAYDVPVAAQTTPGVPSPLAGSGPVPGSVRATQGIAIGPRATAEYDITPAVAPVVSYGEGFRSLDATANVATSAGTAGEGPSIHEGASPYSKVRSVEAGVRFQAAGQRYTAALSAFETWVENELVVEPPSGGFTTEGASTRRGVVASILARPVDWLLASFAGTYTTGTFQTLVDGVVHFIPQVPPLILRADVTARGQIATVAGRSLTGRIGVGYTFLASRYLTEVNQTVRGPSNNILNAGASLRYANVEVGVDAFNVLDLRYADDEGYYLSNWSVTPGTRLASSAVHLTAAPPLTVLGQVTLSFGP
jgi:hypothetical protein